MSFIRRVFGALQSASGGSIPTALPGNVHVCDGWDDLDVVGEAFYQDALWRVAGGRQSNHQRVRVDIIAMLRAEPENPYDVNAVEVSIRAARVGHLSRENARLYQPGLIAFQQRVGKPIVLRGVIVGGGIYADGPGRLGVFLRHDAAEFGVSRRKAAPLAVSRMDTGLSEAIATDAEDDSYDLSWLNELPPDPLRCITALRHLLVDERDPIDRHFMFQQLEDVLYKSRDQFETALDEYDRCAEQHDNEMDTIRAAFIHKWGKVPTIKTYKQRCIRLAKAKQLEAALIWAERGLAIYGSDAARPEIVQDLHTRAASYRSKLSR